MVPAPNGDQPVISVYRRPLPTTNLNFLSTIMFDGRETHALLNNGQTFLANLNTDLTQQALDAITIHAQAAQPPTASQLADIVDSSSACSARRSMTRSRGSLVHDGALEDPSILPASGITRESTIPWARIPTGAAFNPTSMTLFAAWSRSGRRRRQLHRGAPRRGATQDRGGRGAFQQPTRANLQCSRLERQCRARQAQYVYGQLHHVPRRSERWRPLVSASPRYRYLTLRAAKRRAGSEHCRRSCRALHA